MAVTNGQQNVLRPSVFIIGAMKSATTTLAELLSRHPQFAVSYPKEPGYFSRDERFVLGRSWYLKHFAHAHDGQILCDASTCYSRSQRYPLAAPRLSEFMPEAKLIYILRNPVDRAYSHYIHEMEVRFSRGLRPISLRGFLETDIECVSASQYCRELAHLFRWFKRSQLLCVRFEDVSNKPQIVGTSVAKFVGVFAEFDWGIVEPANARGTGIRYHHVDRLSHQLRRFAIIKAAKSLFSASARRQLVSSLERALIRLGAGKHLARQFLASLEPLSQETAGWLHDQLDKDTKRLGDTLDWDVSSWLAGTESDAAAIESIATEESQMTAACGGLEKCEGIGPAPSRPQSVSE